MRARANWLQARIDHRMSEFMRYCGYTLLKVDPPCSLLQSVHKGWRGWVHTRNYRGI